MFGQISIPSSRTRSARVWAASFAAHLVLVALLVSVPTHNPEVVQVRRTATLLVTPLAPIKSKPALAPLPSRKLFELPKLTTGKLPEQMTPSILHDAPRVQVSASTSSANIPMPSPGVPPPPPKMDTFTSVTQAPAATVNSASPKLTGFDAQLSAAALPGRSPSALPREVSGFDEKQTAGTPNRAHAVTQIDGGFGAASATKGTAYARAVTLDGAAFGAATQPIARSKPTNEPSRGAFGDVETMKNPASAARRSEAPANEGTPVEITFQPRPAYTDEARRLKIEGEVVLQVVLTAAGEVRVVKVVRGLGHGLNENALLAASAIRFRPAHKRGEPVDSIATVRMNFQLAY